MKCPKCFRVYNAAEALELDYKCEDCTVGAISTGDRISLVEIAGSVTS